MSTFPISNETSLYAVTATVIIIVAIILVKKFTKR